MKLNLQNVVYRYFAESARGFDKVLRTVKSGEAELKVILDGEEPCAEDLKEVVMEALEAMEELKSGNLRRRGEVDQALHILHCGRKPQLSFHLG